MKQAHTPHIVRRAASCVRAGNSHLTLGVVRLDEDSSDLKVVLHIERSSKLLGYTKHILYINIRHGH
jgi:hypothetical protein